MNDTKINSAGEQQPMDDKGRYTFKEFKSPNKQNKSFSNFSKIQMSDLKEEIKGEYYSHKNGNIFKGFDNKWNIFSPYINAPKKFDSFEEAYNYVVNLKPLKREKANFKDKNKQLLNDAGINDIDRKFIYRGIEDYLENNHTFHEGEIDVGGYTISVSRTKDTETPYEINWVENYQQSMRDLLSKKNIKFEESKSSNSLYFKYKGKSYRISNHRRPLQDSYDPNDEVDENIIVKNNEDRYNKLTKILEV